MHYSIDDLVELELLAFGVDLSYLGILNVATCQHLSKSLLDLWI